MPDYSIAELPSWIWEIDFANDPSSATETWTDITPYVQAPVTIRRGRQVETGRDQAGTCSLVLDNRDRRFDWFNVAETNLIPNPSAETNTTGYVSNLAAISRQAASALFGGFGMQVITTNAADTGINIAQSTLNKITPLVPYTFSLYAKRAAAGTSSFYVAINWWNGPTFIGQSFQAITLNSTSFVRFSVTGTAPYGATSVDVIFRAVTAPGVITIHTDAWQLEQAAAPSVYFDGSQVGSRWAGTAHASISYRGGSPYYPGIKPMRRIRCRATYAAVTYPMFYGYLDSLPMVYPDATDALVQISATDAFKVLAGKDLSTPENLIVNPGAEENLNGYIAYNSTTIQRVHSAALVGKWGILLQINGTANTVLNWEPTLLPEVEPGRTYTFSLLLARNQSGSTSWQMRIDWYAGGAFVSNETASFTVPGSAAARYFVTGVAPVTADRVILVLRYNAATSARDMFTDDWQFGVGSVPNGTYPAQRTDERITAVLDGIEWSSTLRSLAVGSSWLDKVELEGVAALEHLQKVAESESGRLFADTQGRIKFVDRHAPYLSTSQATFGEQEIAYSDVAFAGNDQLVFNEVVVQRAADGAKPKRTTDPASQLAYLTSTLSRTGQLFNNDNESQVKADFELALYREFRPRIVSMVFGGIYQPALVWPQALGRELGDRVTVRRRPPGGGLIEQESFVEWIEHRVGVGVWAVAFGLNAIGIGYQVYPSGKTFFVLGTSALTTGNGVLVY